MHTMNYINLFMAITVVWWSCQLVASSIMCVVLLWKSLPSGMAD